MNEFVLIIIIISFVCGYVCGYVAKFVFTKKEEQRFKQCKDMGRMVWMPRLCSYTKALPGWILGASSFLFYFGILMWGICIGPIMFFYPIIIFFFMIRRSSVFAIVDDSFVMWRYFGFGRMRKFPLNVLFRTEYYQNRKRGGWTIKLWHGKKRILKILSIEYDEYRVLLEHLHIIKLKRNNEK